MKGASPFRILLCSFSLGHAFALPDRTGQPAVAARQAGPPIPSCTTFMIPVSVTRDTPTQLQTTPEGYTIDVLYAIMDRKVLYSNSYELEATFCEPTANPSNISRTSTVQLYVHGATLNKLMWDFPYKPEIYSWIRYMTSQGFSTLTFDLIGAGNSTIVDGLLEAQGQTYVETIHQIVQKLRAGEIGGKVFNKIIPMGFSLGSCMLVSLADQYPQDVDTVIIHGFTWNAGLLYPGYLAGFQTSARLVDPQRWGTFSPQYLTQATAAARKVAAFFGDYDREVLPIDFELRDLNTLGAAMALPFHSVTAHQFRGPVFLGIGDSMYFPF